MESRTQSASTRRWSWFAVLLTLGACSPVAAQTVLVSNLAEPLRAASPIGNNPNPVTPPEGPPWYWAAQSFQPDNQDYSLTSIDARVGDGSMVPLATVVAELHADSGGTIGPLITTLTAPSVLGSPSARTFTPDNSVTLLANTTYWFVLGSAAPGDGTYFWEYANTGLFTGPGLLGTFADSNDSGANWSYHDSPFFPYFAQVNVDPIGVFEWITDSLGDWTNGANWSSMQAPSLNVHSALFGGAITAPRTVVVDSAVTVKKVTFDNANTYAVAGTGSVNLEAAVGNAELAVILGTHEFQARVNLNSDTDADIATDATLEFNNRLHLNGHTLAKTGGGAMQINNDLNMGGGSVTVLAGSVGGGGTIAGDLTNVSGAVAPGNSPGVLTVDGDFVQASDGTLAIELAGTTAGAEHDQLKVTGGAALDGTLEVSLLGGFTPSAGQAFDVLDWGSLTGVFSNLELPALTGLVWNTSQLYTTGVLSVAPAFDADFDEDGDVDGDDLAEWKTGFGIDGTGVHIDGDANGDADVDGGDFLAWQQQVGSGLPMAAAVPEPASLIAAAWTAIVGMAAFRGSRRPAAA